jgi:sterol desaturase/sphingolipid hydroxylase (fatty acid hydroxylase superfamily)
MRATLPAGYRGEVHAVLHFGLLGGLTGLGAAALALEADARALAAVVLLVPPWSLLEYVIHRFVLHGRWAPGLARDHGIHHACFPPGALFFRSHLDLYRVLQRPQDVLALEGVASAVAGLVGLAGGAVPALAVATSANLYFLLYEVVHAVAHSERLSALPLLGGVARSHQAHHGDAQWNFAVVVPVVDRLLGTRAPRDPREST